MPRSHPPTLVTLTKETLRQCAVGKDARVLVAVSGGRDSMALLDVLASLSSKVGFELQAHGVDHGLREGAGAELEVASRFAKHRGIPFATTRVDVGAGGNLQARARRARYAALEGAMKDVGATTLATAHHADDRAETVLIRLLRGAGAGGLHVLPPKSGHKLRPFIAATRADIDAHVTRHAIPFCDDPSNAAPRFLRTRVRNELLPLLRALDPQIVSHLNDLSDEVESVTSRETALPIARATLDAVREALADGQKETEIWLPGGLVLRRERTHVRRSE